MIEWTPFSALCFFAVVMLSLGLVNGWVLGSEKAAQKASKSKARAVLTLECERDCYKVTAHQATRRSDGLERAALRCHETEHAEAA